MFGSWSVAASVFSGSDDVHVTPLSVLRDLRMSASSPSTPPCVSYEYHEASQCPAWSVNTKGRKSSSVSDGSKENGSSRSGAVHVSPSSVLRAT